MTSILWSQNWECVLCRKVSNNLYVAGCKRVDHGLCASCLSGHLQTSTNNFKCAHAACSASYHFSVLKHHVSMPFIRKKKYEYLKRAI